MDSWKRFNETTFPNKKYFSREFNLEDITDQERAHAQKVFEEFRL